MNLGFVGSEVYLRVKTTVINVIGSMGLSVAAFIDSIAFHEEPWFKAMVASVGLLLGVLAVYSTILDIMAKRRKREQGE